MPRTALKYISPAIGSGTGTSTDPLISMDTCAGQVICTPSQVWRVWNANYNGSSSGSLIQSCEYYEVITPSQTWITWNVDYSNVLSNALQTATACATDYAVAIRETAESAKKLAIRAARIAARETAAEKARRLLLDHLDPAQARQFSAEKAFIVHSKDGKRQYRVGYGVAGNIALLNDKGEMVAKFCIHPQDHGEIPVPDVMLCQKLLIETDEQRFLKTANRVNLATAAEVMASLAGAA